MNRSVKFSILSAAVISAIAVSEARAAFVYDLRFAPGSVGASPDLHTATLAPGGGTYSLQLWGRITSNSTANDDLLKLGYVSVQSTQVNGGVLSGGGITQGLANTANFPASISDGAQANLSADSVADWGGSSTTSSSTARLNWLTWQNVSPGVAPAATTAAGFQTGNAVAGQSQPVAGDPNSWEVLIATFSVNAGVLNANPLAGAQTVFNVPFIPTSVKVSISGANQGLNYYQDGSSTASLSATGSIGAGATFIVPPSVDVPEPASLGVLALGGLALLARRRK